MKEIILQQFDLLLALKGSQQDKISSDAFIGQISRILGINLSWQRKAIRMIAGFGVCQFFFQGVGWHRDELLQEWKQAKEICAKIIDISIKANIFKKVEGRQNGQEFMKVYDVVYRLCSNRGTEQTRVLMVYKDYKDMLKGALMTMGRELNKERDVCKVRVLKMIWDAYEDIMKRLKHMFAYLNRPFHLKQARIEDLDRTGMILLVSTFFNEQSLLEYDLTYFRHLNKIRKSGDFADSQVLKDYVDILYRIHLRLLKNENKKARTLFTDFRQKYLTEARHSYEVIFGKLKEFSPSEYFLEVNKIYEKEYKIGFECFGIGCENLISKTFSTQFLEGYREILIESPRGLKAILHNRQASTINIITDLYKKLTNSIDGFKQPFETFVYDEIYGLIKEARAQLLLKKSQNLSVNFIQKVIKVSNELMDILETSFMKYGEFICYFKNGMEKAFDQNQMQVSAQQMLSVYIEIKLKMSYGSEDELREEVRNIINVFSCLSNKDEFLIKYLQRLCRRILSLSVEALSNHQHFVKQLKNHSGAKFTERIETIIDEYQQSMEGDDDYRKITEANKLPYNMNLRIFSEGAWPFAHKIEFPLNRLHKTLEEGVRSMMDYQKQCIEKKTLKISYLDSRVRWIYHFDDPNNTKNPQCIFDTNGVQAVLLYHIYQARPEKISLGVLEEMYPQVKPMKISKILSQMCDSGENVLIKTTLPDQDGTGMIETMYEFNGFMKTKRRLIQYDLAPEQAEQEEKNFQRKELGRDREFTLDANIAKLMKSKKILNFEVLVQEIMKMVKVFSPTVKDIKQSLERLISKELLCRDERDRKIIKYKD